MKVMRIINVAVASAVVLLLAGCILQPENETGSVSLSVTAPQGTLGANAVSITTDSADISPEVVRVWMYTNGSEYRLAPTSADAPSSRNYVETELTNGRGEIVIDGVPAGEGYSLVVVFGVRDPDNNSTFVPVGYARTGSFRVSPGIASVVTPTKQNLVGGEAELASAAFDLVGNELNSVVVANGLVYTADDGALYDNSDSDSAGFSKSNQSVGSKINSLSAGPWSDGTDLLMINTAGGIEAPGTGLITSTEITDVTFSGTFIVENNLIDDAVVFYQRIGGLGGSVFSGGAVSGDAADWEDIDAAEINDEAGLDLLNADETPVRAMASSGAKGIFSTDALGSFVVTEVLFDTDEELEVADLLSGEAAGLAAFSVPFPGTTRPLRLDELDVVLVDGTEYLVVGTPRGAFTFPLDWIPAEGEPDPDLIDESNTIQTDAEGFRSLVQGEPVAALASDRSGRFLAVATAETILVLDVGDRIPEERDDAVMILPRRGASLGEPTGLAVQFDENGGELNLYVAGTEGMTTLSKSVSVGE